MFPFVTLSGKTSNFLWEDMESVTQLEILVNSI